MVAIPLVLLRPSRARFHLPLVGLLISIAILVIPPVIAATLPVYEVGAIAAGLPAIMLIGPFLWLYVSALTSETEWRWSPQGFFHLAPGLMALCVVAGFQALPVQAREAMMLRGEAVEEGAPALIAVLAWLVITLWVPQSCYYLIRSAKRLMHYRRQIMQVFANIEQRQMAWLTLLIVLLGVVWLAVIIAVVGANLFNYSVIWRGGHTLLALLAVWILTVFGFGQQPGYHGHYVAKESGGAEEVLSLDERPQSGARKSQREKYSRSALDQTQSARIANKIEQAMVDQKLYLDSDLSLGDLAKAVNAPANYVSQTLNETLGYSFFDYVNQKRVEAAQLLLRETDRSVLEIAYEVGFNARSSFYKAFQRNTGVSPGKYRQEQSGEP